ncbi:hypothetical protein PanWU01x14_076840 [Parasponia andersonii]|uniref:Uncharacterized protein n=1 Tax=Parasponia andersonii TaxID=3476 RepID=A0A2P5DCF4_PARAD|nr:hypothetical protein PanWU01x14_076840 [Parasponia andersonii]
MRIFFFKMLVIHGCTDLGCISRSGCCQSYCQR